jgi:hypothetical protein
MTRSSTSPSTTSSAETCSKLWPLHPERYARRKKGKETRHNIPRELQERQSKKNTKAIWEPRWQTKVADKKQLRNKKVI